MTVDVTNTGSRDGDEDGATLCAGRREQRRNSGTLAEGILPHTPQATRDADRYFPCPTGSTCRLECGRTMGRRAGRVHTLGRGIIAGLLDDKISSKSVNRLPSYRQSLLSADELRRKVALKHTGRGNMKSAATFAFLAIFGGSALTALAQHQKEPVDYVSPNIGGHWAIAHPDHSICAAPSWHGEACPDHHPGNHRPLSCGQDIWFSCRSSGPDGLGRQCRHQRRSECVGLRS